MPDHKMEGNPMPGTLHLNLRGSHIPSVIDYTDKLYMLAASGILPTLVSVCLASFRWGTDIPGKIQLFSKLFSVKKTRPYHTIASRTARFNVCFVYVQQTV